MNADNGGGERLPKMQLQSLADRAGLTLLLARHLPPRTSEANKIERGLHRRRGRKPDRETIESVR